MVGSLTTLGRVPHLDICTDSRSFIGHGDPNPPCLTPRLRNTKKPHCSTAWNSILNPFHFVGSDASLIDLLPIFQFLLEPEHCF